MGKTLRGDRRYLNLSFKVVVTHAVYSQMSLERLTTASGIIVEHKITSLLLFCCKLIEKKLFVKDVAVLVATAFNYLF